MPVEKRKLTYLSEKCILQHIDVNLRLQLIMQIPYLRQIHNSVPLHVKHIILEPNQITMNGCRHSFKSARLTFENGGREEKVFPYDLDSFGNRDRDPNKTEADVIIPYVAPLNNPNIELDLNELDADLEEESEDVSRICSGMLDIDTKTEIRFYSEAKASDKLREVHATLSEGSTIRNSIRSLLKEFIMVNKKASIQRLIITADRGVLRFPSEIKLCIQELYLSKNPVYALKELSEVLVAPDNGLKWMRLITNQRFNDETFNNHLPRSSEVLKIVTALVVHEQMWLNFLIGFQNPTVILKVPRVTVRFVRTLVEKMSEDPSEKKVCIQTDEDTLQTLIADFETRPFHQNDVEDNRIEQFPYYYTQNIHGAFMVNICVEAAWNVGDQDVEVDPDDENDFAYMITIHTLSQ